MYQNQFPVKNVENIDVKRKGRDPLRKNQHLDAIIHDTNV